MYPIPSQRWFPFLTLVVLAGGVGCSRQNKSALEPTHSIHGPAVVRLGEMPTIKLAPTVTSDDEAKHIRQLIEQLAQINHPDFGISPTLWGSAFAPLGHSDIAAFRFADHEIETSDALRELVAIGPKALPFLLDSLDNATPTQLSPGRGRWLFGEELWAGNPVNPLEMALGKGTTAEDLRAYSDENPVGESYKKVKVGDVCFVIIGQIVGRMYMAVRYQPSGLIVINSPTLKPEMCAKVRVLWSSDQPAQMLLDSLLRDFHTEAIFKGNESSGLSTGFSVASDLQAKAAMRLLFYFPLESAPFVATRLRSLSVRKAGFMEQAIANGVRAKDFIEAVVWCNEPVIQTELTAIAQRTDDPEIREAIMQGRKKNKEMARSVPHL